MEQNFSFVLPVHGVQCSGTCSVLFAGTPGVQVLVHLFTYFSIFCTSV